ncbi:hypothetical protein C2E20_4697 [Micractinium conductrix]|uniref:Uncharacterized protein n=1 Tax=Micractinium conductrix TaxID=554055 RepID=A0A2P6VCZ5_9CHLO|nr:hypothetical protein C2E20_4697 [Micractinium conductrix]|eukprot:PSC71966.1 hypothetical protein C2E20_4697 [Micractinium conductrix]
MKPNQALALSALLLLAATGATARRLAEAPVAAPAVAPADGPAAAAELGVYGLYDDAATQEGGPAFVEAVSGEEAAAPSVGPSVAPVDTPASAPARRRLLANSPVEAPAAGPAVAPADGPAAAAELGVYGLYDDAATQEGGPEFVDVVSDEEAAAPSVAPVEAPAPAPAA